MKTHFSLWRKNRVGVAEVSGVVMENASNGEIHKAKGQTYNNVLLCPWPLLEPLYTVCSSSVDSIIGYKK